MKTKVLISFAVTAKLICAFVFASAKVQFSHNAAHLSNGPCHETTCKQLSHMETIKRLIGRTGSTVLTGYLTQPLDLQCEWPIPTTPLWLLPKDKFLHVIHLRSKIGRFLFQIGRMIQQRMKFMMFGCAHSLP